MSSAPSSARHRGSADDGRQVRGSVRSHRRTSAGFRHDEGRVEKIILRPGTAVKANDVILELTNPTLEQQLQDATLKLQASEAGLTNTKVQLNNDLSAVARAAAW